MRWPAEAVRLVRTDPQYVTMGRTLVDAAQLTVSAYSPTNFPGEVMPLML